MSADNLDIFWSSLAATTTGTAAISGLFTFLFKRNLTRYKSELRQQVDAELSQFKNALALFAKREEVQFTWLHQKRAQIIASLYKKLMILLRDVKLYSRLKEEDWEDAYGSYIFYHREGMVEDDQIFNQNTQLRDKATENLSNIITTSTVNASAFADENSVYFDEEVMQALRFLHISFLDVTEYNDVHTLMDKSYRNKLIDEVKEAMKVVKNNFQQLLGM